MTLVVLKHLALKIEMENKLNGSIRVWDHLQFTSGVLESGDPTLEDSHGAMETSLH